MAGISDIRHELCLALALWNGNDPILKERMFGLTGPQGNHGEDVKEYWWYLEACRATRCCAGATTTRRPRSPTSSSSTRTAAACDDPEFELLDTGVFDDDRYWSVDVTYAKASPTERADADRAREPRPRRGDARRAADALVPQHVVVGRTTARGRGSQGDGTALAVGRPPRWPATGSRPRPARTARRPRRSSARTRRTPPRLFGVAGRSTPYPKDGINDHVVSGAATVNPDGVGTKAALLLPRHGAGRRQGRAAAAAAPARDGRPARRGLGGRRVRRRSSPRASSDADEFYAALAPAGTRRRAACAILRQACAGLVWSKQMYPYNVAAGSTATRASRRRRRRTGTAATAAGGTSTRSTCSRCPTRGSTRGSPPGTSAFHAIPWAHLDPAFAKYQLIVLLREWFQHPNGALPAYEWNFDDVNPPVHALAALRVFVIDGGTDREFLERVFQKLLINFTWWLNRRGPRRQQRLRRRLPRARQHQPHRPLDLPPGVTLEQADGTAWMAYYSLSMLVHRARARRGERRLRGHGGQVPRAVRAGRSGARDAGSLRRRRRLLLRPPRRPVRGVDPGEGADDRRACSRCCPRCRCPLGPSRPRGALAKALRPAPRRPGPRPAEHSAVAQSARTATTTCCSR